MECIIEYDSSDDESNCASSEVVSVPSVVSSITKHSDSNDESNDAMLYDILSVSSVVSSIRNVSTDTSSTNTKTLLNYRLAVPMMFQLSEQTKITPKTLLKELKILVETDLIYHKNPKEYEHVKKCILEGKYRMHTKKMDKNNGECNEKQAEILKTAYLNATEPKGMGSGNGVAANGMEIKIFIPHNISDKYSKQLYYILAKVPETL